MTLDKLDEIENGLIEFMQFEYKHYKVIDSDNIDSLVSLKIMALVKLDDEFKLALGDGYYK